MEKVLHCPSNTMVSVLVKGEVNKISLFTRQNGGTFRYSAGDIAAIRIALSKIILLEKNAFVKQVELPCAHLRVMNDSMEVNNMLVPVHTGMSPLPQAYLGNGVVMGIIDTGIDFSHPDFKDSLGKSRVKFLWDQNLPNASNTPQPYNYGQNWNNQQIDSGQASAHSDAPDYGHGTHVSGVAAGNGLAINKYAGVAPKADLIVVAANLNDTTGTAIPDAVNYIFTKAALLNEPCVINISLGDYYGSHDGLDLQAQVMNNMVTAQSGRVIVAAAGNAGNLPFHLGYTVTSDSNFTWFDYSAGRISLQLWADTADFRYVKFAIGADDISAGYSFRGRTSFTDIFARLNTFTYDTLKNNTNRLGLIRYYGQLLGGRYAMNIDIYPDSTNDKWRLITTGSGKFDTWNFDVSGANLADSTLFPDLANYKLPDVNQTIVNSFQCSPDVITVGNYVNRNQYMDYDTILYTIAVTPQTLSFNSSKGPTRDGRIKPDITASGDYTMAPAVLSLVPVFISVGGSYKIAEGGFHIRDGGTSTASPVVAGIAALYLQRYPNATCQDVRTAITSCPTIDNFTGNNLPNNDWGYGKVNGFTTLTNCLTSVTHTPIISDASLLNFPNPFGEETTIVYALGGGMNAGEIKIMDVLGKVIRTIPVHEQQGKIILKGENLAGGIYYCSLISGGQLLKACRVVVGH